jgi:hypothetical protein
VADPDRPRFRFAGPKQEPSTRVGVLLPAFQWSSLGAGPADGRMLRRKRQPSDNRDSAPCRPEAAVSFERMMVPLAERRQSRCGGDGRGSSQSVGRCPMSGIELPQLGSCVLSGSRA